MKGSQFKFGQTKFLGDALYKPEELQALKFIKMVIPIHKKSKCS